MSTLDSPYANYLTRQFVLTALTKLSSRATTSSAQQERIQSLLASYTTSPELEIQQRAVEFANLYNLGDIRSGVLERMPAPELKQTVIGVGKYCNHALLSHFNVVSVSENKPVGSIQPSKEVRHLTLNLRFFFLTIELR